MKTSAHTYLAEFLEKTENDDCKISDCIKSTMAQFLMGFKFEINKLALFLERDYLDEIELIDCQITVLRECILDLTQCKSLLTDGAIKQ